MIEAVGCPMGLVPGLTGYPSSTSVGTERMVEMEMEMGDGTHLSDDEDAVKDMGGGRLECPKG